MKKLSNNEAELKKSVAYKKDFFGGVPAFTEVPAFTCMY